MRWNELFLALLVAGFIDNGEGQGWLGVLRGDGGESENSGNRRNGNGRPSNGGINLDLGLLNIRIGGNNGNGRGNGNGNGNRGNGNGNRGNGNGNRGNGNGNRGNGNGHGPPGGHPHAPLPELYPGPDPLCYTAACKQQQQQQQQNTLNEFGLTWNNGRFNNSGAEVPMVSGESRFLYFGHNQPDIPYGRCRTPLRQKGECRHLEYCVQHNFRYDYLAFIQYSCPIEDNFVGVCCPINRYNEEEDYYPEGPRPTNRPNRKPRPSKKPKPSTTPAPIVPGPPVDPFDFGTGGRECGISEKPISKIVGGRTADPKAWPWMAALLKTNAASDDTKAGQYCGGVLISEFHIMTAAHCVDGFSNNELRIRLGEYNFGAASDSRRDFDVIDIRMHEKYNRYSYENDIAIIRIERSAYYSDKVRSVCLPRTEEDFANSIGIVTGWGTIYYGGPTSATLTEVLVPVWKQEDCKAAYTQPILETNLCAGVRSGGRDSCQGDSGGPLQLQVNGRWSAIGVVSWGIRCAEPGYPGVYTRVSKYMDWVQSKMH